MLQIRRGCFETNSSSMHSLVIMDNSEWDDEIYSYNSEEDNNPLIIDGVWDLSEEELYFGRAPFRVLSTFADKVRYAYASLPNETDSITEIVKEYIPELEEVKLPEWMGTDEYSLRGWLERNNITLEEFLTHDKFMIICDGDEYCIWEDLKDCGIINTTIFKEV